jgi:hypothetical protein
MDESTRDLRIRQSCLELTRLREELQEWQKRRIEADRHPGGNFRGQYQTQLARIVKEVNLGADAIEDLLKNLKKSTTLTLGAAYQECARHDRRIIWLRRAWEFFRQKFDQRDDPALMACVRAADEVLWSCYKPFFQATGRTMPPAPLPYIENTYSPTAVRVDDSSDLEKSAEVEDSPLKPFFASLPIPLLQLPPASVTSPWMHVLIGHETGHFVQDCVLPAAGYRPVFRERVQALAGGVAGEEAARAWGQWAPEIFADLYAVVTMGPAAVWAVAQFELARPAKVTARGKFYPSALARIYLLAAFSAHRVPPKGRTVLDEVGIDLQAAAADGGELAKDLAVADAVAALVAEPLPDGAGRWNEIIAADPAAWAEGKGLDEPGDVLQWSEALKGKRQRPDQKTLAAARRVAAGTARAWRDILATPSGTLRENSIRSVEKNAYQRMIGCAEPGARAAPAPAAAGGLLAKTLLEMSEEDLFS